jgi:3'-phosphoadenosine 5'-phosphosulfate sulfotransferase (PAPS reductase)/FAD synthetase
MSAHENTVLQFSGGKDSLACLFLLREQWDEMTVLWVNAGAAFPETVGLMEKIRALVPHFLEVRTNQPAQVAELGYPVDVLPLRNANKQAPPSGFPSMLLDKHPSPDGRGHQEARRNNSDPRAKTI